MEESIRNGPEGTDAIDDSFGVLRDVEVPDRRPGDRETHLEPTWRTGADGQRAVPMSALLAADSGHDIDFEPERLGLTARIQQLSQ